MKFNCLTDERINRFTEVCKAEKLPITPQKRAIFEALAGACDHPTAEEIHKKVLESFPTMSFATVYKNLNKFCKLGLAKEIVTDNCMKRYDANMDEHHHLVDESTGSIRDVYIDAKIPVPDELKDKDIKSIQITYTV